MPTTRIGRADVIAAARRLFSQKGYHATSMQDLGDALGLQRGSLYAHIASKEDLLYEIVAAGAARFLSALEPIAASTAPAGDRLREAYRAHVAVVTAEREAATVFFHEWRFLAPEPRQRILALRDAYEQLWRRIVTDGVQRGEFRPVDVRLTVIWLLSPANWLYQWYRIEGEADPRAIADTFAQLALAALYNPNKQGGDGNG